MITFVKEKDLIKIHKNNTRVYTITEKTYHCLNKMGFGPEHVISVIEGVCNMKLPKEDITEVKNYFSSITKETILSKK